MPEVDYRHHGTGLLRATATGFAPRRWPQPTDENDCSSWLSEVWPVLASAVRHASPVLAARVETILTGAAMPGRDVRRAALAVVRYALRLRRPTPFGTFAGVAPVSVGNTTEARIGTRHRPVVRADTRWLRQVIERLESCPELLSRLDVTFNDAAEPHGGRLTLAGQDLVSVRASRAVMLVRDKAASPISFAVLAEALADAFPNAGDPSAMLVSLLDKGFMVTSLRAASTVTDPLGLVVDRLRQVDAGALPVAPLIHELRRIHEAIDEHNNAPNESARIELAARMRTVAESVREPLTIDLRLDAHVQIPHIVAHEMERAASALPRLSREPTGVRAWRDYFGAFCERYGTGTLVPLRQVLDPNAGLGFPRGFPGSPEPSGRHVFSERDRLLFALAAEATACGSREVELDDARLDELVAAGRGGKSVPPHVDLGARIHATSRAAVDRGDFTFTVAPGRAAGTLTSRFTPIAPEAGLDEVFAGLPTTAEAALPVQLSFAPIYPSAENIARVPQYLPDVLSVGEHEPDTAIRVDDLAVTATRRRLHLVSMSRRRVVEPLVLHALALKQQPPVARLIGELSRALDVVWIGFDWGAAETLPFRPRVRYGRAILSAARWRLTPTDLSVRSADRDDRLDRWRATWRCPARIELRDFDQCLPLDLDVPAHREVLYRHLRRHDEAVLLEAPEVDADDWIDGRPHTIVLPLTTRRAPEPAPRVDALPVLTSQHGHSPGATNSEWLSAKLYVPEHRMNALLVDELPALQADLVGRACWFVRYPQAREGEVPDHLRLRVRVKGDTDTVFAAITGWTNRLRADGLLGRLAFDTYFPETGRYVAIGEAEDVFVADSRFVLAQLTRLPADTPSPVVVTALSMFDIAAAFLGDRGEAVEWLRVHAPNVVPGRVDVDAVVRLACGDRTVDIPGWSSVAETDQARAEAIGRYRRALPDGVDRDGVLHSLLHMHHNRALGVDRDREARCLRLARQAAAAWRAHRQRRT